MIKRISFAGKLEINKHLKQTCAEKDFKQLKEYADKIDGDLFIQEISQYKTGKKAYKGYASIKKQIVRCNF